MSTSSNNARPTKNQRREAAREKARELRVEQAKKDKRNKLFLQGGIVLGALVIVGIVVSVILASGNQGSYVRPANMASDGIVLTGELDKSGTPTGNMIAVQQAALADGADAQPTKEDPTKLNIVIYQDYMCPVCGSFNKANASIIADRVQSGAATVELHPIAILDPRSMGTNYSTRAANAAACVATNSPDQFWAFDELLFNFQPAENTTGNDDNTLKELAKTAGVKNLSKVENCIDKQTYKSWVTAATKAVTGASALPYGSGIAFEGTPTVIVNGKQFKGSYDANGNFNPNEFAAFLLQIAGEQYSETATPTPVP